MPLPKYEAPEQGDRLPTKDVVGSLLLVRVNKVVEGIVTKFGEKSAVDLDVCGVATGKVAYGVRWFNGAVVDGLAQYVGQVVPLKLGWVTSAAGNPYVAPEALSDAEYEQANAFYDKGDPFAPEAPAAAAPPSAAQGAPAAPAVPAAVQGRW
jgi:hypothetical protein